MPASTIIAPASPACSRARGCAPTARKRKMRPEPVCIEMTESAPLVVGFADLFDALGTAELRYSPRAHMLGGRVIAIDGFLARPHVPHSATLLVDQPGVCPDCS